MSMSSSSPRPTRRERVSLRRFMALVRKESIQVVRDPSSLLIAFVLPLILLFLFGYGVSLDAENVKIGLVLEDRSPEASSLAAGFINSRFFDVTIAGDRRDVETDMASDTIRGLVVIPSNFTALLEQGDARIPIQILTDGTQPNTARFVENYARGVISAWANQRARERGMERVEPIGVEQRFWFNEELVTRNYLVPGSVAIVMTLIGTLLTALVVSREWERGTMEAMMATPIGPFELLAGKIIPYFVLGLLSMAICTLIAVLVFGVPLRGSFVALVILSSCFMLPALGQGYLISAAAKNQFVASQLGLISGFLPAMLLSGFIFEIGSMPTVIQYLTAIIPARYFVSSLQTLFLAGDVWSLLLPSMAVMLAIGGVFFVAAVRTTKKSLD